MTKVNLNDANVVVSLGNVAGDISVNVAELVKHEAVANYIFQYGLKQMLNDRHASEKDAGAKRALVEKKLASLYAGEVAQQRAAGGDPVAREMRSMAEKKVKDTIKANGKKLSDFAKKSLAAAYDKYIAANEAALRKAAEAKLAIKADTSASSDDIMALFD